MNKDERAALLEKRYDVYHLLDSRSQPITATRVQTGRIPPLRTGAVRARLYQEDVSFQEANRLVAGLRSEIQAGIAGNAAPPPFDPDHYLDSGLPTNPFEREAAVQKMTVMEKASAIYNIMSRYSCDESTICRYLMIDKKELKEPTIAKVVAAAQAELEARMTQTLIKLALNQKNQAAITALIYWTKCKLKWSDKSGDMEIGAVDTGGPPTVIYNEIKGSNQELRDELEARVEHAIKQAGARLQ